MGGGLHPGGARSLASDRQALLSWPGEPNTATAPAIRAGSGGCGYTLSDPARPAGGGRLPGAKADERQVLLDLLAVEPELVAAVDHYSDGGDP